MINRRVSPKHERAGSVTPTEKIKPCLSAKSQKVYPLVNREHNWPASLKDKVQYARAPRAHAAPRADEFVLLIIELHYRFLEVSHAPMDELSRFRGRPCVQITKTCHGEHGDEEG